jgi:hypothetical protein
MRTVGRRRERCRLATLAGALTLWIAATSAFAAAPSLVPDEPGTTPSYWCTWGVQNYSLAAVDELDHSMVAANLTEEHVFGRPGWARAFPEEIRSDLFIVFDLGWDVPAGERFDDARWKLGSLRVASDKFPSCTGTPTERLRALVGLTRATGWRGAGIWVACQAQGDGRGGRRLEGPALEEYWRERLRWSRDAGVSYWKVDYGARGDPSFRRLISRLAGEEAPGLVVEHGKGVGPLNDWTAWDPTWTTHGTGGYRAWNGGQVLAEAVELLGFSDVLRTYDVTAQLSLPTTLDRAAQLLVDAPSGGEAGLLNCEDEPYLGAVLGLAIGVMRHPMSIDIEGKPYDPFLVRRRIDEVVRAVRWQRIAPAVAAGRTKVTLSDERLRDTWPFRQGDSWAPDSVGREIAQTAPAIVARGLPLPEVKAAGEPPYVVASRHPNGALAVGTFPRVLGERRQSTPLAAVAVELGATTERVGVFGRYQSLALRLAEGRSPARVWAQDLAGSRAVDVTDRVGRVDGALVLPGSLIEEIGLSARTPGDLSEPALVLKLEEPTP